MEKKKSNGFFDKSILTIICIVAIVAIVAIFALFFSGSNNLGITGDEYTLTEEDMYGQASEVTTGSTGDRCFQWNPADQQYYESQVRCTYICTVPGPTCIEGFRIYDRLSGNSGAYCDSVEWNRATGNVYCFTAGTGTSSPDREYALPAATRSGTRTNVGSTRPSLACPSGYSIVDTNGGDPFWCQKQEYGTGCVSDCAGKQCGDDGCGGSCGTCESEYHCSVNQVCVEPCSVSAFTNTDNYRCLSDSGVRAREKLQTRVVIPEGCDSTEQWVRATDCSADTVCNSGVCVDSSCIADIWADTNNYRCNPDGIREMMQTRTVSPSGCDSTEQWIIAACPTGQICSVLEDEVGCDTSLSCTASTWIDTDSYRCNSDGVRERSQIRDVIPADCDLTEQWVTASCETGYTCSEGNCLEQITISSSGNTLTIGSSRGVKGSMVTIPVKVDSLSLRMDSFQIQISYDPNVLERVRLIHKYSLGTCSASTDSGSIIYSCESTSPVTVTNKKIFDISAKIKPSASVGTSLLAFQQVIFSDSSANQDIATYGGKVIVG